MTQQFDFTSIADLGKFWDGGKNAANAGGGKFNAYSAGISNRSNNLDLLYQSGQQHSTGYLYKSGQVAVIPTVISISYLSEMD